MVSFQPKLFKNTPVRQKGIVGKVALYLIILTGSFVMAFPLIFGLAASFNTQTAYSNSSWFPFPDPVYLGNYDRLFHSQGQTGQLSLWFLNSLLRTGWYILIPGTVAVLAGYVFARLKFAGRDAIFVLLLSSMMIPPIVYYVPTYIMLARWPLVGGNDITGQGGHGFVNEWPALLLPNLIKAFYIFLMRQTYYTIPADYEEAARVDGANTFQVLYSIYLPMIKPAITVMVIFQFVDIWNDYLWPVIAVSGNPQIWPVALGAQKAINLVTSTGQNYNYPFVFTIATVVTLPTILLFLFLQRYFVEGVQGFGLKG